MQALGRGLWRGVDQLAIDGFVNNAARFVRGIGNALRPSQSGGVQSYLMTMFLGLLVLTISYWLLTM